MEKLHESGALEQKEKFVVYWGRFYDWQEEKPRKQKQGKEGTEGNGGGVGQVVV